MKRIPLNEIARALKEDACAYAEGVDRSFQEKIRAIAEDIRSHAEDRPLVLLTGPSGSGKTTSAKMIEALLDAWGCETHTLSMDDYFLPLTEEQQEQYRLGKLDLEAPGRLDLSLLNEQLEAIAACKPTELPRYDFTTSTRVSSGITLCRKPGELVVLEGIHALNPSVITLPDEQSCRIYVSVRTRVEVDGELLHPSYIRLLRRMLRDRLHRARSFAETAEMYDSVQRGEDLYIMPYKYRADYDVDTFHAYELSALKPFCEQELSGLAEMPGVPLLRKALAQLPALPEPDVPGDSLIREFIGNSLFTN